jgi:DNA primase
LQGRDVIILPDNDEPGKKHAEKIARSLWKIARQVKIVDLPGLPAKGDVSDWLNMAGHSVVELLDIIKQAPIWKTNRLRKTIVNISLRDFDDVSEEMYGILIQSIPGD